MLEIIIKGEAKEIAALVLELQERKCGLDKIISALIKNSNELNESLDAPNNQCVH
jgi:hypothetical protein